MWWLGVGEVSAYNSKLRSPGHQVIYVIKSLDLNILRVEEIAIKKIIEKLLLPFNASALNLFCMEMIYRLLR